MKLRIAGYQDARSVHTRAMRALEASLKTKLGDGIAVEFEENIATRGRKVTDLLDLVESGELDLCYFSSSYVTARVPTLGVFDIPFAMTDRNRTRTLLQGALGERLASDVAARTAYKVLGFWDNGPRHISNRLRAIRMPADCKGIRIRTLPSAGHHATYRALGMEPVTIDIRDFVEAIASEKVDAQENPLTNVRQFGLQKYHRHVTMTAHFHGIALLLCNAKMLEYVRARASRRAGAGRIPGNPGAMGFRHGGRAGIARRARSGGRRHRRSRRRRPRGVPRRGAPAGRAADRGIAGGTGGPAQPRIAGTGRHSCALWLRRRPSGASNCTKPRYRRGPGFRLVGQRYRGSLCVQYVPISNRHRFGRSPSISSRLWKHIGDCVTHSLGSTPAYLELFRNIFQANATRLCGDKDSGQLQEAFRRFFPHPNPAAEAHKSQPHPKNQRKPPLSVASRGGGGGFDVVLRPLLTNSSFICSRIGRGTNENNSLRIQLCQSTGRHKK